MPVLFQIPFLDPGAYRENPPAAATSVGSGGLHFTGVRLMHLNRIDSKKAHWDEEVTFPARMCDHFTYQAVSCFTWSLCSNLYSLTVTLDLSHLSADLDTHWEMRCVVFCCHL